MRMNAIDNKNNHPIEQKVYFLPFFFMFLLWAVSLAMMLAAFEFFFVFFRSDYE